MFVHVFESTNMQLQKGCLCGGGVDFSTLIVMKLRFRKTVDTCMSCMYRSEDTRRVSSHLPLYGTWGLNSSPQTWQQALLFMELSRQAPSFRFFFLKSSNV